MKNIEPTIKLGEFLNAQNWNATEVLSALLLQFARVTYQLEIPVEEAVEVSQDTIEHLYKNLDEMEGKGRGVLQ
jgi:hypothetical protein